MLVPPTQSLEFSLCLQAKWLIRLSKESNHVNLGSTIFSGYYLPLEQKLNLVWNLRFVPIWPHLPQLRAPTRPPLAAPESTCPWHSSLCLCYWRLFASVSDSELLHPSNAHELLLHLLSRPLSGPQLFEFLSLHCQGPTQWRDDVSHPALASLPGASAGGTASPTPSQENLRPLASLRTPIQLGRSWG